MWEKCAWFHCRSSCEGFVDLESGSWTLPLLSEFHLLHCCTFPTLVIHSHWHLLFWDFYKHDHTIILHEIQQQGWPVGSHWMQGIRNWNAPASTSVALKKEWWYLQGCGNAKTGKGRDALQNRPPFQCMATARLNSKIPETNAALVEMGSLRAPTLSH